MDTNPQTIFPDHLRFFRVFGSSQVEQIGYDRTREQLFVKFVSGGLYRYAGVPEDVADRFLRAESAGKFLNTGIKKGGYTYASLPADDPAWQSLVPADAPVAAIKPEGDKR